MIVVQRGRREGRAAVAPTSRRSTLAQLEALATSDVWFE